MRIYVMRHGPAEDNAPSRKDFDRRLTAEGRALVRKMAEALRLERGGSTLPRVLSSPRVRARETAEIIRLAVAPHEDAPELDERLGGEVPIPRDLAIRLAAGGTDALLVGHQPTVEALVRDLIYPAPLCFSGFHTATIVALAHDGERFRLSTVLDPHQVQP